MLHAREDYNRIQDEIIPKDEPVFLLRAQDETAGDVVRYWAELNAKKPNGDKRAVKLALEQAARMDAWPAKKTADIPAP